MKALNGLVGLAIGVLLLAAPTACRRQAGKQAAPDQMVSRTASFPKDDAIAYGVRFAAALPGDEDGVQTQSKVLEEVVQACLLRGATDRAFALAQTIKSWQRGTACADVAAAYAGTGQTNAALRALLVAEAWRALIREQTRDTSMGWTTGRIRDHIAAARAALGQTDESGELLQKPLADINARVLGQWIGSDPHRTNADFMQTLSAVLTNRDYVVQQGFGLGLLAWAGRQETLSTQAVHEVAAVVRTSLKTQPVPYQFPVQVELVRFLRRRGCADAAEATIRDLETAARSMRGGYYLSTGLADAAALCWSTDTNRATNLLDEAETEAGRCTEATRSAALSHVAERLADMGQTGTAQRVYLDALAAAAVPPSAVPRLQRLVETCASMGSAGVSLTPEMRNRLNELATREEAAKPVQTAPASVGAVPEKK